MLILGETPRPKRSRKKKGVEPELAPEEPKPSSKFYEKEHVRLTGNSAQEFCTYLHNNEKQLRQMADQEAALQQKVRWRIFPIMGMIHHDQELNEFNETDPNFRGRDRNIREG